MIFFFRCRHASTISGLAFAMNGIGQISAPVIIGKMIVDVDVSIFDRECLRMSNRHNSIRIYIETRRVS